MRSESIFSPGLVKHDSQDTNVNLLFVAFGEPFFDEFGSALIESHVPSVLSPAPQTEDLPQHIVFPASQACKHMLRKMPAPATVEGSTSRSCDPSLQFASNAAWSRECFGMLPEACLSLSDAMFNADRCVATLVEKCAEYQESFLDSEGSGRFLDLDGVWLGLASCQ